MTRETNGNPRAEMPLIPDATQDASAAENLLQTARRAVEVAQKHGASGALAFVNTVREVSVGWRDGKLEKISEAVTSGLSIEVYADGRYAAVSSSDMRPMAIEKLAVQAIDMARALAPDSFRGLADPKLLYSPRMERNLSLHDTSYGEMTADKRREAARLMEEAARDVEGKENIVSVTTNFSDTRSVVAGASSNGFEGFYRSTAFCPSAEASVRDPDGRRPEDYDYAYARIQADLPDLSSIGKNASRRALGRIGAVKGKSGKYTIAIDPRAAGSLLGRLMGPLTGSALQQRRSMFEGKEGEAIGSKLLDIVDDPFVMRGLGSRLFDGDGIAARQMPIFEAGVLKDFYIDTYYGRKLGRAPTTGSPSNVILKPGTKTQAELLRDIGDGLLVTGFLGGNSNGTTGDFSLGIQGNIIRGGAIAEPFAEMNLSGNHLEFWKHLTAVGSDPYPWSSRRVPTLVFEGAQVAGL